MAFIVALVVLGVIPGIRYEKNIATITLWGVDDPKIWSNIIASFEAKRPGLDIEYKRIPEDRYEKELINAMVLRKGPDIFMFENNWLLKHGDKIVPAPVEKITTDRVEALFPQVVRDDFLSSNQKLDLEPPQDADRKKSSAGLFDWIWQVESDTAVNRDLNLAPRIYALPLYIDTLAMVYDRAFFDQKKIVFPPKTWDEVAFMTDVLKIVEGNTVKRAAFALGGSSKNITNAADIVSAFILQSGSKMIDDEFNDATFSNGEGKEAFGAYSKFADPTSSSYTWNSTLHIDNEALVRGEVAAIFMYSEQARDLERRNSFLDIEIAPLPQMNLLNQINIADYWGLTVSRESAYQNDAWDFIIFVTTDEKIASTYMNFTARPPALRSLINDTLTNPEIGVFVSQALTARSWLQLGEESFTRAINEAIEVTLGGKLDFSRALDRAESIITKELKSR